MTPYLLIPALAILNAAVFFWMLRKDRRAGEERERRMGEDRREESL